MTRRWGVSLIVVAGGWSMGLVVWLEGGRGLVGLLKMHGLVAVVSQVAPAKGDRWLVARMVCGSWGLLWLWWFGLLLVVGGW